MVRTVLPSAAPARSGQDSALGILRAPSPEPGPAPCNAGAGLKLAAAPGGASRRAQGIRSRAVRGVLIATFVALAALAAPAAAAPPQPGGYQQDDAKGFNDVLPPGENGLDNLAQLAAF